MWREGRGRGRREEVMDGVRRKQAKVGGRERMGEKEKKGKRRKGPERGEGGDGRRERNKGK